MPQLPDIASVTNFRKEVSRYLDNAKVGRPTVIVNKGNREGVLVGVEDYESIPGPYEWEIIIGMAGEAAAYWAMRGRSGPSSDSPILPGDPFGRLLAWFLRSGFADRAHRLIAAYVAAVRRSAVDSNADRRPTLDELLPPLRLSVDENWLGGRSFDEFLKATRHMLLAGDPSVDAP